MKVFGEWGGEIERKNGSHLILQEKERFKCVLYQPSLQLRQHWSWSSREVFFTLVISIPFATMPIFPTNQLSPNSLHSRISACFHTISLMYCVCFQAIVLLSQFLGPPTDLSRSQYSTDCVRELHSGYQVDEYISSSDPNVAPNVTSCGMS